jgi:hypothetical protein
MEKTITRALMTALLSLSVLPALADTTTTVTSYDSSPKVIMVKESLTPYSVRTIMSQKPVGTITTTDIITAYTIYTPDDLLTRRDELLARILIEQDRGKLSAGQANELFAKVNAIDNQRACLSRDCSVSYHKRVKELYRQFDKVATSIQNETHDGNNQLAGRYSYVVM